MAEKNKSQPPQFSLWMARILCAIYSIFLITLWGQAVFGSSRGGAVPGQHVHFYFLILTAVCLLGFLFCIKPSYRTRVLAAASLILVSISIWFSLILMVWSVAPVWQSLTLSALWFALPITVACTLILEIQTKSTNWIWAIPITATVLTAILLFTARQSFIISWHKVVLNAEGQWLFHKRGWNALRLDLMLWSISGYPPHDIHEKAVYHRQSLTALGYFHRMDFTLNHATLTNLLNEIDRVALKDELWMISPTKNSKAYFVIAYHGDLGLWRGAIEKVDIIGTPTEATPSHGD